VLRISGRLCPSAPTLLSTSSSRCEEGCCIRDNRRSATSSRFVSVTTDIFARRKAKPTTDKGRESCLPCRTLKTFILTLDRFREMQPVRRRERVALRTRQSGLFDRHATFAPLGACPARLSQTSTRRDSDRVAEVTRDNSTQTHFSGKLAMCGRDAEPAAQVSPVGVVRTRQTSSTRH
jgi:hypothetical protein